MSSNIIKNLAHSMSNHDVATENYVDKYAITMVGDVGLVI